MPGVTKAERRRLRLEIGSQVYVGSLMGVTSRSIIKYEQARKAPRWYELALLGLRAEKKP